MFAIVICLVLLMYTMTICGEVMYFGSFDLGVRLVSLIVVTSVCVS